MRRFAVVKVGSRLVDTVERDHADGSDPAAMIADPDVAHDAQEPSSDVAARLEMAELAIRSFEGVLDQILCRFVLARHPEGSAVENAEFRTYQILERVGGDRTDLIHR